MRFKVDDLLITILPDWFDFDIFAQTPDGPGPCDAGSDIPPGVPDPPPPPGPDEMGIFGAIDPISLRMLMQIALVQLGGPVRADEMRPRTMRDLELLEEKLVMALEEVRSIQSRYKAAGF